MMYPLLTKKEAEKIINCKEGKVDISLDLGLSSATINIKEGFACIQQQKIPLSEFSRIKEGSCYIAENNCIKKLAFFR